MKISVNGVLAHGAGNGKLVAPVFSVSGNSGDVLFTTTDIPSGLTIDTESGLISGTTGALGNGVFTVTATDSGGKSATAQVNYTLSPLSLFSWIPQKADNQNKPRIFSARFGDGYQQDMPQGLNPNPDTYSLTFSVSKSSMVEILAFLDSVIAKPFAWVPVGGVVCKSYKCSDWRGSSDAITGQCAVMATFNQAFGY